MSATNRGGLARQPNDFYETPAWAIDVVLDVLGITSDFDGYVIDCGAGTGAIAHRVAHRAPHADIRGVEKDAELLAKAKETRADGIAWEQADWLTWTPDGAPDFVIANPPYQLTHFDPNYLVPLKWTKAHEEAVHRSGEYLIYPSCAAKWALSFQGKDLGDYQKLADAKLDAAEHRGERGRLVIDDENYAEKFIRKALDIVGKKGTVAMLLRDNFMVPKARRKLRAEFGKPDLYELERRPSFNGSGTDATDYAWIVWSPKRAGRWSVIER